MSLGMGLLSDAERERLQEGLEREAQILRSLHVDIVEELRRQLEAWPPRWRFLARRRARRDFDRGMNAFEKNRDLLIEIERRADFIDRMWRGS